MRFCPGAAWLRVVSAAIVLGSVSCGTSSTGRGIADAGSDGRAAKADAGLGDGAGGRSGVSDAGGSSADGGSPGLPAVPGTPDTSVKTKLPPLPSMINVTATAIDDSVDIRFFPTDGARDYRVYELPSDDDVTFDDSGHITVENALYRCAGDRQTPSPTLDGAPQVQSGAIKTLVDNQPVHGFTRTLDSATLGYVYTSPGDGRVAVYAMGDSAPDGDNSCYFMRWGASRSKKYVFADERSVLLAKKWRDDGIVFYAPKAASAKTRTVYTTTVETGAANRFDRLYFIDGPEVAARKTKDEAFQVLVSAADGAVPLMRVYYDDLCGISHDELAPGKSWFERVRYQGDQQPAFNLHWAGLKGETTLVVEALADGCPYQGFLAPQSLASFTDTTFNFTLPAWVTVDDIRKSSKTGEVYVNGQHDAGTNPRPIARSFVKISPGPKPDMDWFMGFGADDVLGKAASVPCGEPSGNCFGEYRLKSDQADIVFHNVDPGRYAAIPMLGELWVTYNDLASDTNGKFRFTPPQKAQLAADSFLHVTMTVDMFTTGRRYPQFMISDVDVPVQANMASGNTLMVETFVDWPNTYEVQVCDHQYWDVNQQCPAYDLYHVNDPNDPGKTLSLAPNSEVGEHVGMDRATRFDAYASTKRVYLFLDGEPYGCADLPSSGVPSGAVTVTFGDVLYHSGVDGLYAYTKANMQRGTRRHYDNLGFKSGAGAPAWDENRLPCASKTFKH